MPSPAYTASPWSAPHLRYLLCNRRPAADRTAAQRNALWARLRPVSGDDHLDQLRMQIEDLDGEQDYRRELLLLFAVGSLCVKAGQRELWTQMYGTVVDDAGPDEAFTFLENTAAAVRRAEL